eukprot:4311895-Pyramimonas_sp.AAC.1
MSQQSLCSTPSFSTENRSSPRNTAARHKAPTRRGDSSRSWKVSPRSEMMVQKSVICHPKRHKDILRAETGPVTLAQDQSSLPK